MSAHSKLLEDTAIWKTYVSLLPKDSIQTVWAHQIYEAAVTYLKDVRRFFPNYTLHDETHVLNVLDAMAGILGDQIVQLSRGETELLLLSACLHDLGMVYTQEEAEQCFKNKRQVRDFLRINSPELLGRPADEWPEEKRQWYLRWLHPFRLQQVFQNKAWRELLSDWPTEAVPKRCVLAVCQAHGETPEEFSKDRDLAYLAASDADPLFCALLLRLADLLDFDDTRAPQVLYSYVTCSEESQREWAKHRASGGFRYPASPSTAKLPYKARCTNPGIEHTIRDFLNWIDSELNTCYSLQQDCYRDWQRRFPFPRSIGRDEVESEGYVSGDFHMTMDQARVMELLTGEQLYNDDAVFIRELLQNSIDATLLRLKMDQNFSYEDARIDLWEWIDWEGNIWLRIDDQGVGMTLGMLQRYFLKIGNSYYTSQELRRDLREHGQSGEYQSISRFGIGFLSCFLCGTFAEVSTLYFDPRKSCEENGLTSFYRTPDYGLRLQVTGLQGYYTLKSQTEQHTANPMPAPGDYMDKAVPDLEQDGYRAKPGTSIAIRLDPGRLGVINLRKTVKKYLCCAEVPVYYNGLRIGRTLSETMNEIHLLGNERVYELTPELKKKFDKTFPHCTGQYPTVHVTITPLDTQENQMLPGLSGVFMKYRVRFENKPRWQARDRNYQISASVGAEKSTLLLTTQNIDYDRQPYHWNDFISGHSQQDIKALTAELEALSAPPKFAHELGEAWGSFEKEKLSPGTVWGLWLDSFQEGGLQVPLQELGIPTIENLTDGDISSAVESFTEKGKNSTIECSYRGVFVGGLHTIFSFSAYRILLLLDRELRPTVKADRSEISDMPLELIVALRGMLRAWVQESDNSFIISNWHAPALPVWRKLRNSKLWDWLWDNLRDYFEDVKENYRSRVFEGDVVNYCIGDFWSETDNALQFLLMAWLQDSCELEVNYEDGQVIICKDKSSQEDDSSYDLFPPMMFCAAATQTSRRFLCAGSSRLRQCITANHPYALWLVKNATALNRFYSRQLKQITEALRKMDALNIITVCNEIREQLLLLPKYHNIDMSSCPMLSENDFWIPSKEPEDS